MPLDRPHHEPRRAGLFERRVYLAQALVHAACRRDYTARYRLDDLASKLAVHHHADPARLRFLGELHSCDLLVLDDFDRADHERDRNGAAQHRRPRGRGSTAVTSQFDPEDWYKSLHDAVIAESILNRIISNAEIVQLAGPNMRRHTAAEHAEDVLTEDRRSGAAERFPTVAPTLFRSPHTHFPKRRLNRREGPLRRLWRG